MRANAVLKWFSSFDTLIFWCGSQYIEFHWPRILSRLRVKSHPGLVPTPTERKQRIIPPHHYDPDIDPISASKNPIDY